MKSISGIKDIDREILLKMSDKELLKTCNLNTYFKNEVCDDLFFKRRLQQTYFDTLKFKNENENWREYFLTVVYYVAKMKEEFKYDYSGKGNPIIQYTIFEKSIDVQKLLLIAIKNNELSIVIEAIKRKANIHEENDYALMLASDNGHLEIVKFLVKQGADIHSDTDWALRLACEKGHLQVVKFLVENGANINAQKPESLIISSSMGHLEIVKYLLEHGANIHAKNDKALIKASENGHLEVVKYLIENGANISAL